MGRLSDNTSREQEAIKTTIVGGRPPGCGQPVGAIPRGIEILVKKASVDPEFKALLLAKRADAANEIDLDLTDDEKILISVAPEDQLLKIIDQTTVKPEHRSAFLGKVAAVMLAALGFLALEGCDRNRNSVPTSEGIRPDRIPAESSASSDQQQSSSESNTSSGSAVLPTTDTPTEAVSRGVRPDKPVTQGIRPERPQPPLTKGIRPDRPIKE